MSTTPKPSIPRNPTRVFTMDPAEIKYWAKQLKVSAKELSDAIQRVGSNVVDIKRALGK